MRAVTPNLQKLTDQTLKQTLPILTTNPNPKIQPKNSRINRPKNLINQPNRPIKENPPSSLKTKTVRTAANKCPKQTQNQIKRTEIHENRD